MNSDDSGFLFVLFASLAAVAFFGYRYARKNIRRGASFRDAAVKLRGKVQVSDTMEPIGLQFSIEHRPALIEYEGGLGDPQATRVKVAMQRRSPGVFRILSSQVAREQMKFVGAKDIRIGHSGFDAHWFVTARPESLAHRIFSEERREQVIESVRRLSRFGIPSVEITRDTLVVRVDRRLERSVELDALAQTAKDFVGYLMRLGPEEGIAWMAADGTADPGLCPVCAATLEEGVVLCDKCRTPHHEECWQYVGQCSTYACMGKKFVA